MSNKKFNKMPKATSNNVYNCGSVKTKKSFFDMEYDEYKNEEWFKLFKKTGITQLPGTDIIIYRDDLLKDGKLCIE